METMQIVHVDPSALLVDTNVRTQVRIDPTFRASIKTNGVLVPVVAINAEDGLRVRYGQRRTLAAVEVGEPAIPVYIVDTDDEAGRIITQMAENDHRAGLTTAERIEAVQQLSLLGISAAQIVKRTHMKRDAVDASLAIAGNNTAMAIAATHSLDVAAWCAEFAGNDDQVARIIRETDVFGEDRARHLVERYRQQAIDDAAYATAVDAITDLVVIPRPGWTDAPTALDNLVDTDGNAIDPHTHTACPGHAIVLDEAEQWDDDEDSTEDDEDDSEPEAYDLDAAGRRWVFTPYCTDPSQYGHLDRYGRSSDRSTPPVINEAAKQKASAERKRVIAGNKAWDAATIVRAEWVEKLLARKTAPAGAVLFVLRALTGHVDLGAGRDGLRAKVGAPTGYGQIEVPDLDTSAATMALLGLIVTGMEKGTSRDHWRTVNPATALYLTALATWGYTLSDVETAAAGGTAYSLTE